MMAVRALLIALFVAATAAGAHAAPAPVAKPPRHLPPLAAVLADLRDEGFDVRSIERGPEPGTYVLEVPHLAFDGEHVVRVYRKRTVRVSGYDLRTELRPHLLRHSDVRFSFVY
jgi:hypothetical protein